MAGDDPWDLADAVTIWAVPGLVDAPADPALGSVAVVTIVPSMTVHTRDDYPGADVVDVIASGLLARGFALLGGPEVHQLLELPVLADSRAELRDQDTRLRITDGDSALYEGGLGKAPEGWSAAARRRGRLVACAAVEAHATDRAAQVAHACAAGAVVAAQIEMAE
jgi:hypothetical protein